MKIFITGSNGLLGQKLIDRITQQTSHQLIATSKGTNRHPLKEGYVYESLDITNQEKLAVSIAKHNPDVIIHTAAMTNVDQCETDREACISLNVDAVAHLIEIAEKNKIHIVHLSTDFIFDGMAGPYREEDEPNPLSFYGQSKWQAEELLMKSKCSFAILRTIIVYGVAAEMSRSNIVLWAKSALEKGEEIKVVNDQYRMPTLAEDLAAACLSAAEKKAQGVYHVSGKDFMSVLGMVERIADFFALDKSRIQTISSSSLNQAAKRPPRTGFVLDKAYRELDYQPHSFEEGLKLVSEQLNKNV